MPEARRQLRKPKHDASYKRIFAHARTVADLLRGFVGDVAHHLDFTTLERLPASFVTEHLGQRHADLLWKLQTAGRGWLYLLVLLEFQSTVDSRMALRMLDYTVRVLQGLVRDDLDADGRFPPIVPLVIYNGEQRWNAPTRVRDHFAPVPRELVGYLPRHRYLLLELKALDPLLLPVENVVSLVTMLEQAGSQAQLEELGASLADWLRRVGETELLNSFEAWITQVLEERPGPPGRPDLNIASEEDGGMSSALAERVRRWGDELNQQWLEKGVRQGRREGVRQGRREGVRQGRREGIRQGRREGVKRECALIVRLAGRRFGSPVAERLAPLLGELSDQERIASVADAVVECETAEEFLARAEKA